MKTKQSNLLVHGILIGCIVCVLLSVVTAGIFAWMIWKEYITESAIGYLCAVILLLSSITGTLTATAKIKERPLLVALIIAVLYYVLLLSCTALFFGGQYDGLGVTALCIAGGAICVALLKAKQGSGVKKSTRKWKNR